MSQATPVIPDSDGATFLTNVNAALQAFLTAHKGSAVPSYKAAGNIWIDDTATPWLLKVYDGTDQITLGAINASTNTFQPYQGAAALALNAYAADTGAADAYAIAPSPAIAAYATGQIFLLKPTNANTGASTVAVNGLSTKSIKTLSGADPAAGALATTAVHILFYDGTNAILLNPAIVPVEGGGTGAVTASAARTNLGLVIGTDVQAYDADTTKNDVANTFTANQTIQGTSSAPLAITWADAGAGVGPLVTLYRNSASPAANDVIGGIDFSGDSDTQQRTYCRINAYISSPTDASRAGHLDFTTTIAGSFSSRMTLRQGLVVGSATGGDKGAGTINAVGVYDDNTLLTCYVIEAFRTGDVDMLVWNELALDRVHPVYEEVEKEIDVDVEVDLPNGKKKREKRKQKVVETVKVGEEIEVREHFGARKFKERLNTEYDPLDLDKYWNHALDKGHLTSMPNREKFDPEKGISTGEVVQRLWETVEIQAVHIHKLNEKDKAQQQVIDDLLLRVAALENK